jgi:hypothetical protein
MSLAWRIASIALGLMLATAAAIGEIAPIGPVQAGRVFPWILLGVVLAVVGSLSRERLVLVVSTIAAFVGLVALFFPIASAFNEPVVTASSSDGRYVVEVVHHSGPITDGEYVISIRRQGVLRHLLATYCRGEGADFPPRIRWDDEHTATVSVPGGGSDLVLHATPSKVFIVSGAQSQRC